MKKVALVKNLLHTTFSLRLQVVKRFLGYHKYFA